MDCISTSLLIQAGGNVASPLFDVGRRALRGGNR